MICLDDINCLFLAFLPKRLNKERIGELQQQIEDLQKTLQEQGSKTEGVSESSAFLTLMNMS